MKLCLPPSCSTYPSLWQLCTHWLKKNLKPVLCYCSLKGRSRFVTASWWHELTWIKGDRQTTAQAARRHTNHHRGSPGVQRNVSIIRWNRNWPTTSGRFQVTVWLVFWLDCFGGLSNLNTEELTLLLSQLAELTNANGWTNAGVALTLKFTASHHATRTVKGTLGMWLYQLVGVSTVFSTHWSVAQNCLKSCLLHNSAGVTSRNLIVLA